MFVKQFTELEIRYSTVRVWAGHDCSKMKFDICCCLLLTLIVNIHEQTAQCVNLYRSIV